MTRTLTAGMQTAIAAQQGAVVYLFQIDSSSGPTRLCTAPVDIVWDSQTWEGIGGVLAFSAVEESPDPSAQGTELTLSGVDPTVIAVLLNHQMRGREVRIWMAHVAATGTIVADPIEIFRGLQLGEYRITENRPTNAPGSVTIKTRVQSRLDHLRNPEAVRTNAISHNDMLKRAGLSVGDTFMRNTAGIIGRFIQWGPITIGDRGKAKSR